MNETLQQIESAKIKEWWNNQAKNNPENAGVLSVFGSDEISLIYRQKAEWIHFQKIISLKPDMRVLELGCGAGRWALQISKYVREVVAVDFSDEMIRIAERRKLRLGISNVQFFKGPVQDYFSPTLFDIIYLSGVDQYMDDTGFIKALNNINEMLVEKGLLIDRVTISEKHRLLCNDENGYICIYRTFEELNSEFKKHRLDLKCRAPTYQPIRLPRKFRGHRLSRFLKWVLEAGPSSACCFIGMISRVTNWLLPLRNNSDNKTHDFLVYQRDRPNNSKNTF